jgi:hypothetical protein
MALMVERIVDGGVHAEEALRGCCRLEPLHLALSPTLRIFRAEAAAQWLDAVAQRRET